LGQSCEGANDGNGRWRSSRQSGNRMSDGAHIIRCRGN
jgi:hypothetical protein